MAKVKRKSAGPASSEDMSGIERRPETRLAQVMGTLEARRRFQDYHYRSQARARALMAAALLVSLGMNVFQMVYTPPPKYIGMTSNGSILPLVMLDKPVKDDAAIAKWVNDVIVQTLTLDYANYRTQLSKAQSDFTSRGWSSFEKSLTKSQFLETLIDGNYVTTARPTGVPQVVNSGVLNGTFAWQIAVPLQVTLRNSANSSEVKNFDVKVLVVRQPQTVQADGLGVAQILLQPSR